MFLNVFRVAIKSISTRVHCRHEHKIRGQGHCNRLRSLFLDDSQLSRDQVLLVCSRSKLCGYSQTQLLLPRRQNLSGASESAAADIQSPREQSAANENLVVSTCGIHRRHRNSALKQKSPATPWNCRG
jgi:hypothetical protein